MLHHVRCLTCSTQTKGITKLVLSDGRTGFPPCPRCGGMRVRAEEHPTSIRFKARLKAQADLQQGGIWK